MTHDTKGNLDFSISCLISCWEISTGTKVTDELLQSPDFICSLITMEWQNIKKGLYSH
ncbi:MAG: hypothetical protein ACRDD7_09450 [Peptostreptococcaceae bacterium]